MPSIIPKVPGKRKGLRLSANGSASSAHPRGAHNPRLHERNGAEHPNRNRKPPSVPEPQSRLHSIASHFDGAKRSGEGYMALCPAHNDSKPSLHISEGKEGRILVYCHAGCPTQGILEMVGLCMADLRAGAKRIAATYEYRDERGKLLYQTVRYEPKDFRQRRPKPGGGWEWSTKDVRRVLYRLPDLLASKPEKPVFVVEGEKDADQLAKRGLIATTNVGGAGKWRSEYNQHFAGKHVVVLPDNDDPGREHAVDVVRHLAGSAASVKVIELPGLREKGDVSDWLNAGGTVKRLRVLVEQTTPLPRTVMQCMPEGPKLPAETARGNPVIKIIPLATPELGEAAYLGFAGEFLRAVAPYTEATDAGILAHLLPAVGTLVGSGPYVWAGNKQPARVNTVLVGPTNAGRKGTAFGPVDLLMQRVDPQFWARQRVNGLSSGEGLIAYVADREEDNEDGETVIAVAEKRLYVVEEEFSRVLANISREGNILSQVIRACFDNGNLATLTVVPRRASGCHISITGHITPEELFDRLKHIEMANGFGNRFLWFTVKSAKVMPRTRPIPGKVFQPFEPRLRALHTLAEKRKDRPVQMDSSASKLWESVYPALREDHPGLVGAMISRGSTMVLRLALIYALLNRELNRLTIGVEHLKAALAVWEYCEESARLLFQSRTGDPLGDKLLRLLRPGPMTRDGFNSHLSEKQKGEVRQVLAKLEAANLIRKTKVGHAGAGRPAERWELVESGAATGIISITGIEN
jgi:hypothetical protein